jgi:lipopolysaccharide/colanic/teichoic acid biosynthesis glycosyltransferase
MVDQQRAAPIRTMRPASRRHASGESVKRILDLLLAGAAILVLSPMLLLLALIVRMDSRGPVLHRRRVMGRDGAQFDAFKLRTMHVDGDTILARHPELRDALARDHKLSNDPRITRCGVWMRKFSFDELPQLFNVCRGEMSLVGPRMISPPELQRYGDNAAELLSVRPGITGLWQVSGRSSLAPEDRVRLDLSYVRTQSIGMDIALLFKTIPAVLRGRGAY